jgi:hypothetical protein
MSGQRRTEVVLSRQLDMIDGGERVTGRASGLHALDWWSRKPNTMKDVW